MAGAFRILLWAVVVLAPGGILLAPLLAAHELRRRNRAAREAGAGALALNGAPVVATALATPSPSGQLAA
ncbi:MAG: hypothetical protein ABJB12_10675 [Pseudomonadota bacterium]